MKKILVCCFLLSVFCGINAQVVFKKNKKYGIKNSSGKVITKAKYDHIGTFDDGLAISKLKGKYGIINSKGVEITKPIYQKIEPFFYLDIYIDVQLDGKWGVLNKQGQVVVVPKYYESVRIDYFSEYTIVSMIKSIVISSGEVTKMYGAIDNETLKEIISPKYVYLVSQNFGYFEARLDEKYKKFGLIDTNEKVIFPLEYENIFAISKDIIAYEKNKKFLLVNSKGYSISSVQYDEVYKINENRAKVSRNGKFGFIDEKGKEIIACKYDDSGNFFYNQKVKVELNGTKFQIDTNGNEVTVSETIKPKSSLVFYGENDKKAFDLINFKENVSSVENLKLVDNFLNYQTNYAKIIEYIDNLISEAASNKIAYKEFTNYLYAKYSNSEYACYDAIPIHVSQKYMCNTDAPYGGGYWLGAENKIEICNFGRKYKPSLCGEAVSDVHVKLLPQTNSNYLHLDDLQSKYTLLHFWSNDCPGCEKQIQFLASNYDELKKLGVEIVGVSGDYDKKDKAEQLIVSNNMDWINTVDLNHTFIKKLNVTSYPHLFLLDKDKKIIIKAISAEKTLEYLKR